MENKETKRELWVVGNHNSKKPFMVVEYFRGDNNYVGHKVLARFTQISEAEKFKQKEILRIK